MTFAFENIVYLHLNSICCLPNQDLIADLALGELFLRNKNLKYIRFGYFDLKGVCFLKLPILNIKEIRLESTYGDCAENLLRSLYKTKNLTSPEYSLESGTSCVNTDIIKVLQNNVTTLKELRLCRGDMNFKKIDDALAEVFDKNQYLEVLEFSCLVNFTGKCLSYLKENFMKVMAIKYCGNIDAEYFFHGLPSFEILEDIEFLCINDEICLRNMCRMRPPLL